MMMMMMMMIPSSFITIGTTILLQRFLKPPRWGFTRERVKKKSHLQTFAAAINQSRPFLPFHAIVRRLHPPHPANPVHQMSRTNRRHVLSGVDQVAAESSDTSQAWFSNLDLSTVPIVCARCTPRPAKFPPLLYHSVPLLQS
jgi:hypothetical protein